MKCLVDGDLIAYSCAAATEGTFYEVTDCSGNIEAFKYKKEANTYIEEFFKGDDALYNIEKRSAPEPLEFCLNTVNHLLCSILEKFSTNEYTVFLTGSGNFREEIYPEYKANRKDLPKPTHLQAVREYLIDQWDAVVVDGQEADDGMSIEQWKDYNYTLRDYIATCQECGSDNVADPVYETAICTLDKDLDMCAGWHYNWRKDEKYWIDEDTGLRNFYKQLLTGDNTDNIPGIKGIGPKKAERILEGRETELAMWDAVWITWMKHTFPDGLKHTQQLDKLEEEVIRNGQLLWMRRIEHEWWSPPV